MGEFEQFPAAAPNYKPESNASRFDKYILPMSNTNRKNTMLQGGVADYESRTNVQLQNGITDNQHQNNQPLQGAVRDSELRTYVNPNSDTNGIYTSCWKISDANSGLNRDVFFDPNSKRTFHDVYLKQSDFPGTSQQVNLYDNTGHVITPVYRSCIGGFFQVTVAPAGITLYDGPNYQTRHNNPMQGAIPDSLKQKYSKYKPMIQGLLKQLR